MNVNQKTMIKTTTIELNEEDVINVLKQFVSVTYNVSVTDIQFYTGVRGNYDHGSAVEYVKSVICECEQL